MGANRKRKADKKSEETLEVVCRVAPYHATDPCVIALDDETIRFAPPTGLRKRNGEARVERNYKFGHVFDAYDTQRDVFGRCAADFVGDLVTGRNSLLFTYGVTGSGKTYTMSGKCTGDESGILPRAADVLFNSLPTLADKCVFYPDGKNGFCVRSPAEAANQRRSSLLPPQYELPPRAPELKEVRGFPTGMIATVFVSYVEIYNEYCYDLFDDTLTDNRTGESKQVRVPQEGAAFVERLTEVEVQSSDELLLEYFKAQDKRKISKTLLNHQSSRSHSIFSIRLVMAPDDGNGQPVVDNTKVRISQMSLVDLAGSERVKRTGTHGDRFNEACNINESLRVLRQCFDALRKNQSSRRQIVPVPYRDQKLTRLFKSFFEGHGRIRMIVCLNPQPDDYEENAYVLEFAELAKSVDVPASTAPDLPLGETSNLPYRRRDVVRWYNEMDEVVDPKPPAMQLFDDPPEFQLDDPEDARSVRRLREYFTKRSVRKLENVASFQHHAAEFGKELKERLCYSDLDGRRFEETTEELEGLRHYSVSLNARNKNLQRENNALLLRLSHYESQEENERRRHEEARLRQADQMVENILHMIEVPVSVPLRTPTSSSAASRTPQSGPASRVAYLRKQFGESSTPTRTGTRQTPKSAEKPVNVVTYSFHASH